MGYKIYTDKDSMTGYENYTNEDLEAKIKQIEIAKYEIEREIRHRAEAAEREKYSDIIGHFFVNKKNKNVITKVTDAKNGIFTVKTFCYDDTTCHSLLTAVPSHINLNIFQTGTLEDIHQWDPITEEEANAKLEEWKRHIDNWVRF